VFKDIEKFTAKNRALLSNHPKVLGLVSKKMSGNGGKPSRLLLNGLVKVS
jgi:hypothetical protein